MPSAHCVDAINSKLSVDVVLPVTFVPTEAREANPSRYKRYEIINGKNPMDEVDLNHPPPSSSSSEFVTIKVESENDNKNKHVCTRDDKRRPCRPNWAANTLSSSSPYRRALLSDLECRTRYVLDDADYEWCEYNNIDSKDLAKLFTILEWRYVSHAINAAASYSGEAGGNGTSLGGGLGSSSRRHRGGAVTAPSTGTNNDGNGSSTGRICAVCCKPGQKLPPSFYYKKKEYTNSASSCESSLRGKRDADGSVSITEEDGEGKLNISSYGFSCDVCNVWAHTHCWGLTKVPALSPSGWKCDACFLLTMHKRRSTLRCVKCNRSGGVMIPYVSTGIVSLTSFGAPSNNSSNAVTNFPIAGESHGRGKTGRASPLASATTITAAAAIAQNQQHLPPGTDAMCHVVCALAFPDTEVYAPRTVIQQNGLVERTCRPYAYAVPLTGTPSGGPSAPVLGSGGVSTNAPRRYNTKQRAQLCIFCQHEVGCVRCSYPRCFEMMHASCAADEQSLECFSASLQRQKMILSTDQDTSNEGSSLLKQEEELGKSENLPRPNYTISSRACVYWHSCHTYCRQHFNFASRGMAGWRQLAEEAEEAAVKADLAELLRRAREDEEACEEQQNNGDARGSITVYEEMTTTPIPRKRPRGRPPAAIVEQRKAYRQVVDHVTAYWQQKRRTRRSESGEQVAAINYRQQPVVSAALRPEIIKISPDTVRLSHFLSLVPEWQLWLVSAVEHELPIPDEEYTDVQTYRKEAAASTGVSCRRAGGKGPGDTEDGSAESAQLQMMQRMTGKLNEITTAIQQQVKLRQLQVEVDVAILENRCQWD